MNELYKKNVIHRDLNINNVLLHFSKLEPTVPDLQDPEIFDKIDKRRQSLLLSNLTKE